MTLEPFSRHDIESFLDVAHHEGWVAEAWEFEYLLNEFPEGCLTARNEAGTAIGFITSVVHQNSGWIGNLIVAEEHRGKGMGELLFMAAMGALNTAGVDTIWLTASKMGMGLYEKHGFTHIDTIQRWNGTGRMAPETREFDNGVTTLNGLIISLDNRAWGDTRETLLATVMARGKTIRSRDGFVTTQPCGNNYQIGPFTAQNIHTAGSLLISALDFVQSGSTAYLDVPAGNRDATYLLKRNSFHVTGTNELMYFGKKPELRQELIYGLATMGSCG